ncbi:MAG: macro domain-containing protein [Thermodesulfovibrionia bacterium]|nr:macro domain-containing protein [Thermodesulfovibrionia bacterium]
MMIKILVGDLFESRCQTLVNTINTVGIMGKGIALEFKKRFPDMFEDYVKRCKEGKVKLGEPYLFKQLTPPWILNFPTKEHWRSVSRLSDIVRGLKHLEQHYQKWGITSIALPPLGCGHGQLEWRIVGPSLYRYMKRFNVPVELYAPIGTSPEELTPEFLSREMPQPVSTGIQVNNKIEPGLIVVVEVLSRIEKEPYHWPIGRTMFQKIAYFATELGLRTGLHYSRSSFGPFASDLKFKITKLVNNGLIKEEQLGRMFSVKIGPTYEDANKIYKKDLEDAQPIIEKLTDLFLRINTTHQAELAATVHFAALAIQKELKDKPSETDVLNAVMEWKQRRKPSYDKTDVAKTIRNLASIGLLSVKPSNDLPVTEEVFV